MKFSAPDRHEGGDKVAKMTRAEADALLKDIRSNHARRDACPRHLFLSEMLTIGRPMRCEHCGSTMQITDAGFYVKGYVAAGGNPNDVWPGWNDKRK